MTPERFAMVHRALTKIAVECAWVDLEEARLLVPSSTASAALFWMAATAAV
jgi:hypothetical protein